MLGKDICVELSAGKDLHTIAFSRVVNKQTKADEAVTGDLTDPESLRRILERLDPDIIIHCAALVDLEECERHRKMAYDLHVRASRVLASHRDGRVRLIYISTDSVFDGVRGNYAENDVPRPVNYYAATKFQGELACQEVNTGTTVLRLNIYGFHTPKGKSLAEWAINNLSAQKEIFGFEDVRFNPLYTRQAAKILYQHFLDKEQAGVWHLGSDRFLSKYEFLIELAGAFGFAPSQIRPSSIERMPAGVRRPRNTTLNTAKVAARIGTLPTLVTGLSELHRDYLATDARF